MKVWFYVVSSGERVERVFDSEYLAWEFIKKAKHSNKIHVLGFSYLYK